jgi:glutamate racemase
VVEGVLHRYLDGLFDAAGDAEPPDTLLLGCTRFPVFAPLIARMLGAGVTIVDSAATTADALRRALDAAKLTRAASDTGTVRLLATDGAERFARTGATFLGRRLEASDIEIVDLARGPPILRS